MAFHQQGVTCRLTMAQALIRFLSSQYITRDNEPTLPLFAGCFGIFGHGNLAGILCRFIISCK